MWGCTGRGWKSRVSLEQGQNERVSGERFHGKARIRMKMNERFLLVCGVALDGAGKAGFLGAGST